MTGHPGMMGKETEAGAPRNLPPPCISLAPGLPGSWAGSSADCSTVEAGQAPTSYFFLWQVGELDGGPALLQQQAGVVLAARGTVAVPAGQHGRQQREVHLLQWH